VRSPFALCTGPGTADAAGRYPMVSDQRAHRPLASHIRGSNHYTWPNSMLFLAVLLTLLDPAASAADSLIAKVRARDAAVVLHRQPAIGIVSIRMSVLANDPAGYAGVGHMIQHLLYPSLQDRVGRVGGELQIQRTSDAIVYTATGPAAELTYLSGVLKSALQPPQPTTDALLRAERELREERLAEWETAPGHARSMLRAQLFPADVSAAGTERSATRFTASALPRVWSELYSPDRVSIIVVGDVFLADVQAAFTDLPAAATATDLPISRDSVVLGSLAPPQATRAWVGAAYLASELEPAAVTVTTRLLGDLVRRRLPMAQVEAEHWWTHHGQAVALIVAVPEPDLDAARRALGTAVATLADDVSFLDVTNVAAAARREMLFYSRTPDRMAEVIGQFVDREGDPNATERFYAALDGLDDTDVRNVLEHLFELTPARVEIPPQVLRPRVR
jgi:predicted Zn-dependent peptidase